MASSTRERLIEAATARFYRDGFRGVGLDQILDDVGISKTAFYKHFESKEELMLEVLRAQDAWLRETFARMVRERAGEDAAAQLRAVFDVVEFIVESDGYHGCFFVNAAMEFPLAHDPAHEAAASNKRAIEEAVREMAARAGAADAGALAAELCLVMEGAYVTRQVTGNREATAIARRVAEGVIARHLGGAGK